MLGNPRRQVAGALHVVQYLFARMAGQHVGREQHHLAVRVDDLAILGNHAQAVAVAIEGDADFSVALLQAADQVLQVFRMGRIRMVIRESAVHFTEQLDHFAAHAAIQVARECTGHTVAAIDRDLDRACQLDVVYDALQVGGADVVGRIRTRRRSRGAVMLDDALVQRGDRLAVDRFAGQHHLEAVIVRRIVAAGDHDAGRCVQHVGAEVDHRRGHYAQVDHVHAGCLQALRQRCGQFRAGQTAVTSYHHLLFALSQCGLAEGLADLPGHARVQGLADNAADVVGFEDGFGQGEHKKCVLKSWCRDVDDIVSAMPAPGKPWAA